MLLCQSVCPRMVFKHCMYDKLDKFDANFNKEKMLKINLSIGLKIIDFWDNHDIITP